MRIDTLCLTELSKPFNIYKLEMLIRDAIRYLEMIKIQNQNSLCLGEHDSLDDSSNEIFFVCGLIKHRNNFLVISYLVRPPSREFPSYAS